MSIETLSDIAEEMANLADIYGGCNCEDATRHGSWPYCCRPEFVANVLQRMQEAAAIERKLSAPMEDGK